VAIFTGDEAEEASFAETVYSQVMEFCFQNDISELMEHCLNKLIYKTADMA
jgi:hypothetical protein